MDYHCLRPPTTPMNNDFDQKTKFCFRGRCVGGLKYLQGDQMVTDSGFNTNCVRNPPYDPGTGTGIFLFRLPVLIAPLTKFNLVGLPYSLYSHNIITMQSPKQTNLNLRRAYPCRYLWFMVDSTTASICDNLLYLL